MNDPARRTRTRTVTATETVAETPMVVVPRGRSKAEQRLAAIAALHQPVPRTPDRVLAIEQVTTQWYCSECKQQTRYGEVSLVRWPCNTAKLLGEWPGEPVDPS